MRTGTAAAGSTLFFGLAPGTVAGLVPWLLTGWQADDPPAVARWAGGVLMVLGAGVLLHAFARFVREGLGTPAPVAPTARLVVGGLYRFVRNPMYLAVVVTILGQALLFWSPSLLVYATVVAGITAAFVRGYEEPTLRQRFGDEYEAYRRAVPGWRPRWTPWSGNRPTPQR
jgi:protein-S-isoprenylcysteine O-methyltransferase Ste14